MKIDWKRKLTSRKLWMAVIGFISSIMLFTGAEKNTVDSVAAIIMNGATVIAYVLAEGFADGNHAE